VLEHDGRVLTDSSAILRYLEERFPDPPLLPEEPAARAYCDLVEDWADGSLAFVMGAFRWLNRDNREVALGMTARELGGGPLGLGALGARFRLRYRAAGYSATSLAHFEERLVGQLCTLAALLEQRAFLLGRTLTLADVAVFAQLAPLRRFVEAPLLDAQPGVARWLERVAALPAGALALAAGGPAGRVQEARHADVLEGHRGLGCCARDGQGRDGGGQGHRALQRRREVLRARQRVPAPRRPARRRRPRGLHRHVSVARVAVRRAHGREHHRRPEGLALRGEGRGRRRRGRRRLTGGPTAPAPRAGRRRSDGAASSPRASVVPRRAGRRCRSGSRTAPGRRSVPRARG